MTSVATMRTPIRLVTNTAPRAHLFTAHRQPSSRILEIQRRNYASDPQKPAFQPFGSYNKGPSPPRLPKDEQDIFDELQRQSTGAFSTPRSPPKINQSPHTPKEDVEKAQAMIADRVEKIADQTTSRTDIKDEFKKVIEARGDGEELHPNVRRGARPEFEGETNPKTGEVGGPKNEPLRWGAAGEWSYNGRTTDF